MAKSDKTQEITISLSALVNLGKTIGEYDTKIASASGSDVAFVGQLVEQRRTLMIKFKSLRKALEFSGLDTATVPDPKRSEGGRLSEARW